MAMVLERDRKLVEAQVKDMHARLDEAEHNALKVTHFFFLFFFFLLIFLCLFGIFMPLPSPQRPTCSFNAFPVGSQVEGCRIRTRNCRMLVRCATTYCQFETKPTP